MVAIGKPAHATGLKPGTRLITPLNGRPIYQCGACGQQLRGLARARKHARKGYATASMNCPA